MTPIRVATSLGAFLGRLAGGAMPWRSTPPPPVAPTEAKASATGPLIAFESLRQPIWTPRDYAAFAREGFMGNAIVSRCVRMTAETAASVPLLLYRGEEEIPVHPLLDLINRPNPIQVGPEFLEALFGHLLVAGNSYIEAVAIDGDVRELHTLRPDRMKVVPGADGWPEAFEYTVAGRTVRLAGEDVPGVRNILHMKLFHAANDHYGMSPLEAAATAIDLHNTAARWNKALLDNSARPSGALVYTARDGNLTAGCDARRHRRRSDQPPRQRDTLPRPPRLWIAHLDQRSRTALRRQRRSDRAHARQLGRHPVPERRTRRSRDL